AGGADEGVNDRLMKLLFFIGGLRDHGAGRVTAVLPYLAYARKDRRTKARDPVTSRYVAQLLEAVGVHRLVAMDVHNLAAYQNAFRIPAEHLEARPLFVREFLRDPASRDAVLVSPDAGGYKRVERLRETLTMQLGAAPDIAFMEKKRSEGVVSGEALVGDVKGRTAVILDDLISTGSTLARAADACRRAGAVQVIAAATHGLFTGDAARILSSAPIDRLIVADTVPVPGTVRTALGDRLTVLDTAPLVAAALRCLNTDGSLGDTVESFV
ncbi:MAG: ribose-phosphate diphosphokinase, partial [Ectothiorhodospiraceae bacterium]